MVGHQTIGVDGTTTFFCLIAQLPQKILVIGLIKKTGGTVVAALDHMQRHTWNNNAWCTGHNDLLLTLLEGITLAECGV